MVSRCRDGTYLADHLLVEPQLRSEVARHTPQRWLSRVLHRRRRNTAGGTPADEPPARYRPPQRGNQGSGHPVAISERIRRSARQPSPRPIFVTVTEARTIDRTSRWPVDLPQHNPPVARIGSAVDSRGLSLVSHETLGSRAAFNSRTSTMPSRPRFRSRGLTTAIRTRTRTRTRTERRVGRRPTQMQIRISADRTPHLQAPGSGGGGVPRTP